MWAFPFFYWLFYRREGFLKMFFHTALLILATALPIALFYFLSDDANAYMTNYFQKQIVWNSQHEATVNSRFAILGDFLRSVLPPLLIAVLITGFAYAKKQPLTLLRANQKPALLYLCITLSGVLPIMISLKQSSFYILTVFPFFAIALALLLLPVMERFLNKPQIGTVWFRSFTIIVCCFFIAALSVAIFRMNKIGRDNNKISDCYKIIEAIGGDRSINICPELYNDWSLHGYYARYGNISLIPYTDSGYGYFLTNPSCHIPAPGEYTEINLSLKEYRLFIKK
jgi:hypothetical protein